MMTDVYNSLTDQSCVMKYLQGLNFNKIMERESCDVNGSLENLSDTFTNFAPYGPKSHLLEESKVEYLYKSMIGE